VESYARNCKVLSSNPYVHPPPVSIKMCWLRKLRDEGRVAVMQYAYTSFVDGSFFLRLFPNLIFIINQVIFSLKWQVFELSKFSNVVFVINKENGCAEDEDQYRVL